MGQVHLELGEAYPSERPALPAPGSRRPGLTERRRVPNSGISLA